MGLADLHIHTNYSFDGTASVAAVLQHAKGIGLDVIAITDHNEIDGALEAHDLASEFGIEVIPGIEISTLEGDLLALFVTQKIQRDQPLLDTVLKVGELGGICIAPHPMDDGYRMHSLGSYPIMKALRNPDAAKVLVAIETYNATILDRTSNGYARILAEHLEIAQTGSSDAERDWFGQHRVPRPYSQGLVGRVTKWNDSSSKRRRMERPAYPWQLGSKLLRQQINTSQGKYAGKDQYFCNLIY